MKNILFVCTGNTCRSPMAEVLFRQFAQKKGVQGLNIASAGLAAVEGAEASENAVRAAAEVGCDLFHFHSHQLTPADLEAADLVVTMTPAQADKLRPLAKQVMSIPGGIPDPYGGNLAAYRVCRDAITAGLPAVLDQAVSL